jgi:glycosyltransferase involved in cell wall biosynthesis
VVAVVIPAYNAASTLPELLRRATTFVEARDIVVVDDGSTDETGALASRSGVTLLHHVRNRGKGGALRTGFAFVKSSTRYDSVITMDADLQHRPEELPAFMKARENRGSSIIVGCRNRVGTGMPLHRILSNTITSALVAARTGVMIKDSQSGYRLIGREVLDAISFESDGYEAETELLIKSALKGFTIEFIPITTVYGDERSHMTHWDTTRKFLQVLLKEY